MAVKKVDAALQKNIDMVVDFLNRLHQRRSDTVKKLVQMQQQDSEFEKLLQVSLLKLLAVSEFTNAGILDKPRPIRFAGAAEQENRAYG